MAAQFEVFRLSLLIHFQRDFLSGPDPTREEYLRHVFKQPWTFTHYGATFYYCLDEGLSRDPYLLGRVGRAVVSTENMPPDQGLAETLHEGWKASVIVLDPQDHEDGQKISVQINSDVGKPLAVLSSLLDAINVANIREAYEINVQPVFNAESFWEFAAENRGNITSLTFEFVTPNGLWSASSSLRDELGNAREKLKAKKVINIFQSDEGVNTDSEPVHQAVAYVESGSGVIKARAKNRKKYNSRQITKTTTVPEGADGEQVISIASRHIGEILDK